jgi:hypothetical protein
LGLVNNSGDISGKTELIQQCYQTKTPLEKPEGLIYGWVSKYREMHFPSQYYKEFCLTKKYFENILLTF